MRPTLNTSSRSGRGLRWHLSASSHIILRCAAMFRDEIAWIQPAVGFFAVTGTDKWGNEFAHFKMEMRKILTVGRSNGGDLLAAPHILPRIHQYRVAMAVI